MYLWSYCSGSKEQNTQVGPGKVEITYKKKFFSQRAVKHWNRLPREVVEAPSLEVFEGYLYVVPKDKV